MSMDPLDRKIGLISKDGVPGFCYLVFFLRWDLNGFHAVIPLQIWFDPLSLEADFQGWRMEDEFVC